MSPHQRRIPGDHKYLLAGIAGTPRRSAYARCLARRGRLGKAQAILGAVKADGRLRLNLAAQAVACARHADLPRQAQG